MTNEIVFTKAKLRKLKAARAKALIEGKEKFEFEGQVILVSYAKYLIEYLEGQLV